MQLFPGERGLNIKAIVLSGALYSTLDIFLLPEQIEFKLDVNNCFLYHIIMI